MLSIVNTWGHMQYFFKSCLVIAYTGLCSVSLMRMQWRPVPQQINAKLRNSYNALVYITNIFMQFAWQGFLTIIWWQLFF